METHFSFNTFQENLPQNKVSGFFFFFLMKPQSYFTYRTSHEWFSKTPNMAEFRGQSQTGPCTQLVPSDT